MWDIYNTFFDNQSALDSVTVFFFSFFCFLFVYFFNKKIQIRLCRRVSDKDIFTWLFLETKLFFGLWGGVIFLFKMLTYIYKRKFINITGVRL